MVYRHRRRYRRVLLADRAVGSDGEETAPRTLVAFARGEAIDCAYAVPQYLRNNVAKTAEERRNTGVFKALSTVVQPAAIVVAGTLR